MMAKFIGRGQVDQTATLEWPVNLRSAIVQRDVHIGRYTYLRQGTSVSFESHIGRYCSIARNVEIGPPEHPTNWLSTHPFQYEDTFFEKTEGYGDLSHISHQPSPGPQIGHDVWIAAKSVVRRGIKIGNGAIIGTQSFVNADVPPFAIVAGTPARLIRMRFSQSIADRLEQLEWWNLLPAQMANVEFNNIEKAIEQIGEIRAELSARAALDNPCPPQ